MRRVRETVLVTAGIAALVLLTARYGLGTVLASFARLEPLRLLAYVALACAALIGHCLRWQFVARALGLELPFGRLVRARMAGDAIGWLVPSARMAGEPMRFVLIHRGVGDGPQTGAAIAIDRIIESVANLVCALIYIGVFLTTSSVDGRPHGLWLGAALTALLLLAIGTLLILLRRGFRPLRILYGRALRSRRAVRDHSGLRRALDAIERGERHVAELLRNRPGTFALGLVVSLATEAVVIAEYHTLLQSFDIALSLPILLMSLVTIGMTRAVPTPGAVGALEVAQVTLFRLATGQGAVGFVVGIVFRLHETLWTAAGLAVLLFEGVSVRSSIGLATSPLATARRNVQ